MEKRWRSHDKRCLDCDVQIQNTSTRCHKHAHAARGKKQISNRPSRRCHTCRELFQRAAWELADSAGYCSRKCWNERDGSAWEERECLACTTRFQAYRKSSKKYC